jgi:hexokinase
MFVDPFFLASIKCSSYGQNVPAELTALINDTTGTLIASHYVDPKTKIACIFGTGCNAAYMEHVDDIPKTQHLGCQGAEMAINCEWVGVFRHPILGICSQASYRVLSIRSNMNIFRGQNTI